MKLFASTPARAAALVGATALAIGVGLPTAQADTNTNFYIGGASVHPLTLYYYSTDYTGGDFTGSSASWSYDTPCTTGIILKQLTIPASFNDDISSYEVNVDCLVDHYQSADISGLSTGWESTTAYMPADMNDQTSSEQWTHE